MRPVLFVLCLTLSACTGGDTGKPDSSGGDDTAPAPFACGEETCDARTQYCYSFSGGAIDTSGEGEHSDECKDLPAECLDAPTCECVQASPESPSSSSCDVRDGAIYLSLDAP